MESIVHLTHSNDHNPVGHHSQHSENSEEVDPRVELNSETLKSKNPFKILKVLSTFKFSDTPKEFKTYYLPKKLDKFQSLDFKSQLQEGSPPFLFI